MCVNISPKCWLLGKSGFRAEGTASSAVLSQSAEIEQNFKNEIRMPLS